MRQFRFITERHNLTIGSSVLLTDEEAAHAHRTLRLSKGDQIFLFNGEREYRAILKRVSKEAVMAKIVEEVTDMRPDRKVFYTMYVGMPKIKNFELILEKATELGVSTVVPVITEYSIIKSETLPKKYDRWQKIVETACKQSERIDIPIVEQPIYFSKSLDQAKQNNDINFFFSIDRKNKGFDSLNISKDLTYSNIGIFIGPEGGFSPTEIEQANEVDNIKFAKLFDEILRSETAAISALSIVRYLTDK